LEYLRLGEATERMLGERTVCFEKKLLLFQFDTIVIP